MGVIYRHPGTDVKNFINAFNNKLSKLNPKHKYYILGDININVNTVSSTQSTYSDAYLNMLTSNGTFLLIDKPTRETNTSSSIIDHIITNDNNNILYPCIIRSGLTDHFPVACFVAINSRNLKVSRNSDQPVFIRDKRRFDRDLFSDDLNVSLCELLHLMPLDSPESTNNFFSEFINVVTACIDRHAPLILASRRKRKLIKKPWITKGIYTSIRRKQKLYVSHFLNGSEVHKRFYKTYANKLTKIKTLAKKLYFQNEIVNSRHDMRKFWGVINSLTPYNTKLSYPFSIIVGNSVINTPAEIADEFNKHFCSIGKKLSDEANNLNPPNFNQYLTNRVCSSMFLRHTTVSEIFNLINQLNCNKSCGADGVDVFFVKAGAIVIAPILSILFNACFKFGIFPSNLKVAKIIPVFKSGEKNYVTNYRPISILSYFSKILEKAVYDRTTKFLNDHSVLSPTQYGFRSKFSTEHAVLDIVNTCYDNIEKKKYSGLVLLDLAKAFDMVDYQILLHKLDHYGIRGIVLKFFQSFLENRKQFVSINRFCSTLRDVSFGVPQGSTLGPLLFLLYINDLPNSIDSVPRLFADDTCLLVNSSSLEHLESKLNIEINKVNDWITANKLTLNAKKSNLLVINPKLNSPPIEMNLICPAGYIQSVNKAKYLGIYLDYKLNFFDHIKMVEIKVARSVGILNKLKYVLPKDALQQLYHSLVHSHFIYGISVWGNTFPTYISKLHRLQNKAIRIVTGNNWNENAAPLYKVLKILPLPLLFQFSTAKFAYFHNRLRLPPQFDNYFTLSKCAHSRTTRFSSNNQLIIPLLKSQRTQRSIKYIGAKLWNCIPDYVRKYSFPKFKKEYKIFLLSYGG